MNQKKISLTTGLIGGASIGLFIAGIVAILITALNPKGKFYGVQMKRGLIFFGLGFLFMLIATVISREQEKNATNKLLGTS